MQIPEEIVKDPPLFANHIAVPINDGTANPEYTVDSPVAVRETPKVSSPRIVIIGGGFGGLAAAQALRKTAAHITLIDRTNHHLFQPLLYQVATSELSPGQIGFPIRGLLRKQKNTTVILGEVTGVDKDRKYVFVSNADREGVPIAYDYLILATGVGHSYFGHDEFEKFAPGLKSLADAVAIRNKILQAFEQAEAEEDPSRHRDLLTFVLVGAGPTGVEMAGAIAVLVRSTLKSEFRRIDPTSARIVLVDMAARVLRPFSEDLSEAARKRLERLGVEVRLGHGVDQIDANGVVVAGDRIESKAVIWTAGVSPSPAGKWLNVETDRAGRVRVQKDLRVPAHPEVFVLGDTAAFDQDGKPLPGVAQVAIQQGHYAGNLIHRRISGKSAPGPFRYFDKGSMAVVGKGFAVLQSGTIRLAGYFAWLAWAFVHLRALAQPGLRMSVFVQWAWTYVTGQRGSRLIVKHHVSESESKSAQTAPDAESSRPSPGLAAAVADPSKTENAANVEPLRRTQ
jgi:NADH:quinone reductase (non-electrogenic)